jgi:hypothetical protein
MLTCDPCYLIVVWRTNKIRCNIKKMQLDTQKHKNDATEKLINSNKTLYNRDRLQQKKLPLFFLNINVASSFEIVT